MVFISKEKLHVSAYSGIFWFWQFSAKRVLYNMPKPRGDDEISSSPRGLGVLYKSLLAENCQNQKMPL